MQRAESADDSSAMTRRVAESTALLSLRDIFDQLPCMAFLECGGMVIGWNELARELTGIEGDDFVETQRVFLGSVPSSLDGRRQRFEGLIERREGLPILVSGTVQPLMIAGEPSRLVLALERDEGLTANDTGLGTLLQELFDSAPEAMAITHQGRVLHVNREFVRFFGYSIEECMGADLDELVVPDGRLHESEILLHSVETEGRASIETVRRRRDGQAIDVAVLVSAVRIGIDTTGLLVTYRDISQQKEVEARLQHTDLHDDLTGLPNRALFLDRLRLTLARLRRRPDRRFAVLFLDLDGFKEVNDSLGHEAGDALLVTTARRLQLCLRPQDTVARLGGDEFAMLLDEVGEGEDAALVAARIQVELKRAVDLRGGRVSVSASIGIAVGSTEYAKVEEIMRDADFAMYQAKANGKGRHEFFNDDIRRRRR
jgi:diguanylate cyclase (GGDEF)-like protein/PAS domain S-box-containing protein